MLPKAEGSLALCDFPTLIQTLYACRWTGTATLTLGGVGKSVFLEDGRLVFASSTSADDRLGELLLRRGRITLQQLTEAGTGLGPGKRLGAVLVEQGALTPKDLVRGVVEHTQEIIHSLFQWTEGRYRLQEGRSASGELCARSTLSDFEVCRCLWGYRVIGAVARQDQPEQPPAAIEDAEGLGSVLAMGEV